MVAICFFSDRAKTPRKVVFTLLFRNIERVSHGNYLCNRTFSFCLAAGNAGDGAAYGVVSFHL